MLSSEPQLEPQGERPAWGARLLKITREALVTVVIFALVSTVVNALKSPELESDQLPPMRLALLSGERVSFAPTAEAPLKAPLVLYFWGTWCPVCSAQSPVINSLAKGERAQVLTIAARSGKDQALKAWLQDKGYSFPVYSDQQGQLSARFKVSAYPTIFIYDRTGQLRFTSVGYSFGLALKARLLWLELWGG